MKDTIKEQIKCVFLTAPSGKQHIETLFHAQQPFCDIDAYASRHPFYLSQTRAWGWGPPGGGSCGEALQTPLTEELGEATAQSIISQKESLSRVLLRGREQAERPGLVEASASWGLMLSAQILMDCAVNAGLKKCLGHMLLPWNGQRWI